MFVPHEPTAWPEPGGVRDLRVSLNAPVLLGADGAAKATRAALGWLPAREGGDRVRLWLRAEGEAGAARAYELPERVAGPAARAKALEGAERFLAGLGFLFGEAELEALAAAPPLRAVLGLAAAIETSRTSDPGPDAEPGAAGSTADAATAVRADVRLTKFRRRGPQRAGPGAGGMQR